MRVLVAIRFGIEREALTCLLESEQGCECFQVAEWAGLEVAAVESAPDILLMEYEFCGGSARNALLVEERLEWCLERFSGLRVIVLDTSFCGGDLTWTKLRAVGVQGYVSKSVTASKLISCLSKVFAGGEYVCLGNVDDLVARESDVDKATSLSRRQKDVLVLIANGLSTKQMALKLERSVKTIESHRAKLMERLDIHDVPGLVKFAIRVGLVPIN